MKNSVRRLLGFILLRCDTWIRAGAVQAATQAVIDIVDAAPTPNVITSPRRDLTPFPP